MDKRFFIAAVTENLRVTGAAAIPQSTVEKVLTSVVSVAQEQLKTTGKVRVPGLVNFKVSQRAERKGRNPKTGEPCVIPAGRVVRSKAVSSFAA